MAKNQSYKTTVLSSAEKKKDDFLKIAKIRTCPSMKKQYD